jgi:ribosomal protein S18 acetylase RimI-like enzyme
MMQCEVVPADEVSLDEQTRVFNEAFSGYLAGSMQHDTASFGRVLSAQGVDLCYSRFARRENAPAGFGFINRTGQISRLCGMGVVPEARRQGVAAQLLRRLIDEAKERGDRAMTLECFEQNSAAIPLYRDHGFREVSRLFGWRRAARSTGPKTALPDWQEIPILDAVRSHRGSDYPELPWQISRHAAVKVAAAKAFCFADSSIVVASQPPSPIRIYGMFSSKDDAWPEWRLVLTTLLGCLPEREFFAPAIFPEKFGDEIFAPLGFTREPLNQFLMRLDLDPPPASSA